MGSDGMQITIPDFNDDDDAYRSGPLFGRAAASGGQPSIWGNATFSSLGLESPTISTPQGINERPGGSYFHARGDSSASQDSGFSAPYNGSAATSGTARKASKSAPFTHSTQSSVATTSSSPFAKKSSFASLRNAFKSAKSNDVPPPMPTLDMQAYPALNNPFNRSTSSLAQAPPMPSRQNTMNASPPNFRPATPGGGEGRAKPSKSRDYTRSQHSHSGSLFHNSDNGSDHGIGHLPFGSPPPLPPMPNAFGMHADDAGSFSDAEDRVVPDPKTPSDYALHAIFLRFAASAESHIDEFLRLPMDREPHLEDYIGPGVDEKFDDMLSSLGKVAQRHAQPVIDSIMRWRKSQSDPVSQDVLRHHLSQSPSAPRAVRMPDVSHALKERKLLASIYIMSRALIAVAKSISKDGLPETEGHSLEELTFDQFKRHDPKMTLQSANHRCIADLHAALLGHLADIRFESVTDRFLTELGPIAAGQVAKDADMRFENLVKGLKHIHIKASQIRHVWPPERFEEGAEFLAALSKSFENAHGNRLKTIFAETMVQLLHPIGKTAQAEVNHPEWAKAMEVIYPKARDMTTKPRYWHVAYPLAITALCVAPHEYFLRNWTASFEAGLGRLKEKVHRMTVLNGMMRLLWTYLYRCHEPASTVSIKLDGVFKHFFPPNRLAVVPQEDHLQPFIYMVHFALSRHFDIGSELCLDLLQERNINAQSSQIAHALAPERMTIATQAILLSLNLIEREESVPSWPSSTDFTSIPPWEDYPSSSSTLPAAVHSKTNWMEFLDRANSCLAVVARACFQSVGKWSVLDEQWSTSRLGPAYEETNNYIVRHHPEGSVAYSEQYGPQINVLQVIYQSWPRCLHSTLPPDDAFDMLIRGVIHIEPAVGEASTSALQRFMADPIHAPVLLSRFSAFLFSTLSIAQEGFGMRLPIECARLLNLWISFVDRWIHETMQRPVQSWTPEDSDNIISRIEEIETGALFLLAHRRPSAFTVGVKAVRLLKVLMEYMSPEPSTPASINPHELFAFVHGLFEEGSSDVFLRGLDDILEPDEAGRLEQWRQSTRPDKLVRLADSEHPIDRVLWRHVYSSYVQTHMDHAPSIGTTLREKLVAAASRGTQTMLQLSGVTSRLPTNVPQRTGSSGDRDGARLVAESRDAIGQWYSWLKLICATALVADSRPALGGIRDHSRARSDTDFGIEQMQTTHDLFWALSRFLDSDYTIFREVAVSCISSFPASGYSQLLEDLSKLQSRQHYDDPRTKSVIATPMIGRARRQERFHTAVARIYFLTAHSLQDQRSTGRQAALTYVLKYVRNTQTFLTSPDNRDRFSMQRLRRYFCGTIERLFDALATLKDSDRFIPHNLHLSLYTMCEEWCQLGKQSEDVKMRLVYMQTMAAKSYSDPASQAEIIQVFQTETRALSHAAIGAMAALCQKAFFPPDVESNSPTDRQVLESLRPLQVGPTLDRLTAILASFHEAVQAAGKKALRSLLSYGRCSPTFLDECLRRAFVTSRELDTSNARFFEVVADAVCSGAATAFSFAQIVCLGLSNLCHPLLEIRRQAFNMLELVHEQSMGIISLSQYEAAVGSSAPSTYLHAHRLISDVLAGEHPDHAIKVLAQLSDWLPRVFDSRSERGVLLLLQSLEYWVPNIDLMNDDKSGLSSEGRLTIYHLMTLTLRYAESYAEQVLVLWTRLVDTPNQSNGHAVIRFLLEQSHKVGSTIFISCAAKIVACLSQSVIGRQMVEELCSVVEPARMLPSIEHKLAHPNNEDLELWSDLDILFSEKPRLSLGVAQFALLFLSETALERYWEFQDQLPVLFHALFMHLDHRQPFVQQRSRHMLFQLLRSCLTGYDELPDRSLHRSRPELKAAIQDLEKDLEARIWKEDESGTEVEAKMRWFGNAVLTLVEPLHPKLSEQWGTLALNWGTACSIRPVAFRSLQLYRALTPRIGPTHIGMLLGRLANTIADEDLAIQSFNVEIISTLTALAGCSDLDSSQLPQLFWCAVACLSTIVETEFLHTLHLLDAVLTRIDLNDPDTADLLFAYMPTNWTGSSTLQSSLLTGLRSSVTSGLTLKILQQLAKVEDSRLIDPTEGRVRDLYTLSLPWCLHAMSEDIKDESLQEFALNISRLAEEEERPSIERIMTSFAKGRFRTRDDFLRQSVASLREHYGVDHWTDVITLLMGLVLNDARWLQVQTMQLLKVLFQQRETKSQVDLLGSELLMPLLRLLETDRAAHALDVLDEPMQISGGPAAKHVLRMSLHHHLRASARDVESVADVFGIPQPSGWCVPRAGAHRDACRANVVAVFDLGKGTLRPSRIDFQPDDELAALGLGHRGMRHGTGDNGDEDDIGDMVQDLHELSSYFQEEPSVDSVVVNGGSVSTPVPNGVGGAVSHRQLEARVAAILAKSAEGAERDVPPTPFVDVFSVNGSGGGHAANNGHSHGHGPVGVLSPTYEEDSEDESDSDTESDLFEYDSPSFARFMKPAPGLAHAHNSH
ncbi:cell morphogenesis N-terminal-domain-containing protein [Lenzites betulinus]|nr:cell morphogenesis N-terminal-domain-containing protein [Lenzites betulinus]